MSIARGDYQEIGELFDLLAFLPKLLDKVLPNNKLLV